MNASDLMVTASFACSLAFFALAGVVYVLRRPQPAPVLPAMSDLGSDSPAVANLLANGGRLTPEAVPATLFDLAARRAVKIEEPEPGEYACRLGQAPSGVLTAYESRVLALLRKRASGGVVPAKALTAGPSDEAKGWMKAFRKEVVSEANAAGKCEPRWPRPVLTVMGALVLGALLLAVYGGNEDDSLTWPQAIAAGIAIAALLVMGQAFTEETEMVTRPAWLPRAAGCRYASTCTATRSSPLCLRRRSQSASAISLTAPRLASPQRRCAPSPWERKATAGRGPVTAGSGGR